MRHAISPERYKETLEDYDRLLSRDYDPKQDMYRAEHHPSPLTRDDSQLDTEKIWILEELGFLPTLKTHSILKDGSTTDVEVWVDASGATSVEFVLAPTSQAGMHFVSTYFADGTAITVWPSDSSTVDFPSPVRENIRGEDDLRADIATGLSARAERLATGGRPLLLVDVDTARRRSELHIRFVHADPVEVAMATIDTSELWKVEAKASLAFLGLAMLFAAVFTLLFGLSDAVLTFSAVVAMFAGGGAIRSWWTRDKAREPFPGMTNEQAEGMMRELLEKQEKQR